MTLAPWCSNETWTYWRADGTPQTDPEGCTFAKVTGRNRCPAEIRRGLFWWAKNSYEQTPADAPWWMTGAPEWLRQLGWAARNPAQNLRMFIWGCADRNYTVQVIEGHLNPLVIQRDDVGEIGYQRCRLIYFEDGSAHRDFASYSGPHLVWQRGCQPNGFYGIKLYPR